MTIPQLSVHIENEPGRLLTVTEALGRAGVNIRGLTLQEAEVNGTLRLITSDLRAARNILMSLEIPGSVEDVVAVRIPDAPGSLADVLDPLYRNSINIRYAYSLLVEKAAVIILRCSDNRKGEQTLDNAGFRTLSIEDVVGSSTSLGNSVGTEE